MFVLTQTTTPTVIVNSGGHGTPVIVQIVALLVAPALALREGGGLLPGPHPQEEPPDARASRMEQAQDLAKGFGYLVWALTNAAQDELQSPEVERWAR